MKNRNDFHVIIFPLSISLFFLFFGGYLLFNDLLAVGRNSRTLGFSVFGGHLMILVGLIFLVITYFCLSPFNKIREFFEGKNNHFKKKK